MVYGDTDANDDCDCDNGDLDDDDMSYDSFHYDQLRTIGGEQRVLASSLTPIPRTFRLPSRLRFLIYARS